MRQALSDDGGRPSRPHRIAGGPRWISPFSVVALRWRLRYGSAPTLWDWT
jgi:hypothetical protein